MRVTILATGSRGDVEPYVALARGLHESGQIVKVATHATYESLIRARGLEFAAVSGDYRSFHESRGGREALAKNRGFFRILYQGARRAGPILHQVMLDGWRACQGSDAIVVNQLSVVFGYHIAEKLGVPLIRAFNMPVSPTRAYAAPFLPSGLHLRPGFNLMTHDVARGLLWAILRSPTNQARQKVLDLPRITTNPYREMDRLRWPLLYGYSPAVVRPQADWGDWIHVTGYWFLDRPEEWQPTAGLIDFLNAGPPPVYVGFGSMTNQNPEQTTELVMQALAIAGQRGVLVTGWGGLAHSATHSDVYIAEEVPFDWLFPRMAATVHHGGIGTTHLGLRAGAPTVIVPFLPDQRFWGEQVYRLGVGPRPIPRHKLTADRLAAAIRTATADKNMHRRAVELGKRIASEDGIGQAVNLINSRLSSQAA